MSLVGRAMEIGGLSCTRLTALVMFTLATVAATAQPYPERPVRMVVPFPAGGGIDTVARIVALKLAEFLDQPIVIDNRPGAGGIVGTELVAKAAPDGYTILLAANSFSIQPALRKKLPYDVAKDFAPVTSVSTVPLVLVVDPALPVRSLNELIALARGKPADLRFGSGGTGSMPHLAGELFKSMAGIDIVHVPYRGVVLSLIDLAGKRLSLSFPNAPVAAAFIKSGKIRAVAVTSTQRIASLPQTPTMSEAGLPGYEAVAWYALMAPAKTPQRLLMKLHGETTKVLQLQEIRESLAVQGAEVSAGTPEQLRALINADIAKWSRVAKAANITLD